jgi:mannose-6-phosphate isomerase-like protein (cupin superfamily)
VGGYTILRLTDVPDAFGGAYPGEMRFLTGALETEQLAFTYRRMPQGTGGKGSYGHRHRTQEEIYFLFSGRLEAKLDDEVVELEAGTALRVAPHVVRSLWNAEPEDAELVIVSVRLEDPRADGEIVQDFWPA